VSALTPDKALEIQLSAIMARGQFANEPAPVIDELRAVAKGRADILASAVGRWIGFYEDKHTRILVEALRLAFDDLDLAPGIALGVERRNRPVHGTHDFQR